MAANDGDGLRGAQERATRARLINNLACPTLAKRPIESQCVFSRLSHRVLRSPCRFGVVSESTQTGALALRIPFRRAPRRSSTRGLLHAGLNAGAG